MTLRCTDRGTRKSWSGTSTGDIGTYWQSVEEEGKAETRALTVRDRSPEEAGIRVGGHLQR